MASSQECKAFINEIAPYAQKAYQKIGKVKPSICIAMACVESAYGTSKTMRKHNAFFGQKVGTGKTATKYWSGKFYTSKTSEEYTVGVHTPIKAAFRAYDSMEQSVFNFYELLNTPLYSKVKAGVHYSSQMKQIKECGYMTSSTEVNSVIGIISRYDLTKYDGIEGATGARLTLKRGSRGTEVIELQKKLTECGYDPGTIDGMFGPRTLEAVLKFQADHDLKADGIVGAKTWSELLK